jgi:uncharacterized membrane protein YkoI
MPGKALNMLQPLRKIALSLGLSVGVLAMTTSGVLAAEKEGREVDVPRARLPENVAKAATDAVPGGKIADIDKDTKDGKTIWEIGVDIAGGKTIEVDINDDGKVLLKVEKKEDPIKVAELPAVVSEGVKKDMPGCKVTSALKITKGDAVTYELTVDADKKTFEVVATSDGKVQSKAEVVEDKK